MHCDLPFAQHLVVCVAADGVPDELDLAALLLAVPHERHSGLVSDVRLFFSCLRSPWLGMALSCGLAFRSYAPDAPESVSVANTGELLLSLVEHLRDRSVDAVLVVGVSIPILPLVRLVHDSGRPIIVGVRAPYVERALRAGADAVVDVDAFAQNRAAA